MFDHKIITETGVSLFSITCKRCGGRIGGPEIFCQGTDEGISWEKPPKHNNGQVHQYLAIK